ncbi:class I adenylate cyclase, partial [Escherichia coli]|nr:class I adenylate cyclase [Escherichia coli]
MYLGGILLLMAFVVLPIAWQHEAHNELLDAMMQSYRNLIRFARRMSFGERRLLGLFQNRYGPNRVG